MMRGYTADGTPWKVNTEICEETFSWLCGYKRSARQMTEARFKWFMLAVCWLRNNKTVCIVPSRHRYSYAIIGSFLAI